MDKKNRGWIGILMLALGVLLVAGCIAPAAAPQADAPAPADAAGATVKIGFLAAATGGAAFLGKPEQDAAIM